MNEVIHQITGEFVVDSVDDMLVFSKTQGEHINQLCLVIKNWVS